MGWMNSTITNITNDTIIMSWDIPESMRSCLVEKADLIISNHYHSIMVISFFGMFIGLLIAYLTLLRKVKKA